MAKQCAGKCGRFGSLLAGVALLVLASAASAVPIGDTYTRPNSTALGVTEVGGYAYVEYDGSTGAALNVAEIAGQWLHIHGFSTTPPAMSSNHGQVGILAPGGTDTVQLPNVDISADMRFALSNTTGASTTNYSGFVLRKPTAGQTIYTPGQVEVYIAPTGGLSVRETQTWNKLFFDNPFLPGVQTNLNVFQPAGSLPTMINGRPFDANGNGRLEADEPFGLRAVLDGNRLQVLINDKPITSVLTTTDGTVAGTQTVSLIKNRYTSSAPTISDPYYDNLVITTPAPPPPCAGLAGDTFTRADGAPATDSLGASEIGGYDWSERGTAPASVSDMAAIVNGELSVHGGGGSNPGQAVLDVKLPDVYATTDMRFALSNTTGATTTNSDGFMLRKPALDCGITGAASDGQITVQMLPTGGLLVTEQVGGGYTVRYHDNPFAPGTTVNAFQAAGSLPTAINGAGFDLDGDGRLEADELFQLGAIVSGNRLQVLINDQPVVAVTLSHTSGSGASAVSLFKNRYTSSAATHAPAYFDNLCLRVPDFVIRHRDDNAPLLEGWIEQKGGSNVTVGPVTETIGGKEYEAWVVDDNYGGRWHYQASLTDREKALAAHNGWKYTMLARLVDVNDAVDFSCHGEVSFDGTTYAMAMGTDSEGNALVNLYGVGETWGQDAHMIAGGSIYHLYEIVFDPNALAGTGAVNLFVDGELVESGFTGRASVLPTLNRITWGSNHTDASGQGNYAFVQFAIVPEPTTLALLCLGALGLLRRRRR